MTPAAVPEGVPETAPATATALAGAPPRERRRRGFVRDYSYVRAEVRAIILLDLAVLAGITAFAFLIR